MFPAIVFLLVTFIAICTIYENFKYRSMKSIPGPTNLPLIGGVLEIGLNASESLLNDLKRLMDKYGGQGYIFKGSMGLGDMHVVIADPELAEHFLSSSKNLRKGDEYNHIRPWVKNGLLTSTGTYWQKRRKMLTTTFHFNILEKFIPIFNSGSDILVERLLEETGRDMVDIFPLITAFALDIICETAMGTSINAQRNPDNLYFKAVKEICRITVNRTFSFWKRYWLLFLLSTDYRIQQHYIKVSNKFTKNVIENRRIKLDTSIAIDDKSNDDLGIKKKQVFLDLLLNCTIDGEPLSDDDILEEVNTFLFAGHDTSSSIISFTLYALAQNPDIQNKVYEEIKEVLNTDKNYQVTLTDLNNLKYLELVIKESLRMYPPVPLFGRQLEEDVTYKDITFAKGCSVSFFILYMHHRPDLFENPEKFQPDRFLGKQYTTKNNFSYIPFSAGPRNCIGQKLAMYEVKVALSKLIGNFEFIAVDKYQNLTFAYEVVLKPVNGIYLKLRKRN